MGRLRSSRWRCSCLLMVCRSWKNLRMRAERRENQRWCSSLSYPAMYWLMASFQNLSELPNNVFAQTLIVCCMNAAVLHIFHIDYSWQKLVQCTTPINKNLNILYLGKIKHNGALAEDTWLNIMRGKILPIIIKYA